MSDRKLSERIAEDKITITSERRGDIPLGEDIHSTAEWWDVRIHHDGRYMVFPWGINDGSEPEVTSVMAAVVMGVRSAYHNKTYAEWADDWGFPLDSEHHQAMFMEWESVLGNLRYLLRDKFPDYMESTEDDI